MVKKVGSVLAIAILAVTITVLGLSIFTEEKLMEQKSGEDATESKIEIEPLEQQPNGFKIIIDPGHGGYDPGKVGVNNALEKDINLAISLLVETQLKECGYEVIMTRDTDTSMKDNGSDLGKVQDLEARVQIINDAGADLAISVHQNSYVTEDVKGAQVFYYEHSVQSEQAAIEMQNALLVVDETNHRKVKGNTSYYLLKRTQVPTIIVECGFLSNPIEANSLCDGEYQNELAESIVQGVENYIKSL